MNSVRSGAVQLTWDPDRRVAALRFAEPASLRGRDSAICCAAFAKWVGDDPRPFALLCDGQNYTDVDAEARAIWAGFFRAHKDHSYVAAFQMNLLVRIASEMFRIGTGIQLRMFKTEADARAWLRGHGVAA